MLRLLDVAMIILLHQGRGLIQQALHQSKGVLPIVYLPFPLGLLHRGQELAKTGAGRQRNSLTRSSPLSSRG